VVTGAPGPDLRQEWDGLGIGFEGGVLPAENERRRRGHHENVRNQIASIRGQPCLVAPHVILGVRELRADGERQLERQVIVLHGHGRLLPHTAEEQFPFLRGLLQRQLLEGSDSNRHVLSLLPADFAQSFQSCFWIWLRSRRFIIWAKSSLTWSSNSCISSPPSFIFEERQRFSMARSLSD